MAASGSTPPASRAASEPGGFHQPCYSPPSATDPERVELRVYPQIAIGLVAAPAVDLSRIFSVRRASCCRVLLEGGLSRQA